MPAGVLTTLLDIQADPVPLSNLVVGLITAAAGGLRGASPASDPDSAGAPSILLPAEAQPLIRLLEHASGHLSGPGRLSTGQQHVKSGNPGIEDAVNVQPQSGAAGLHAADEKQRQKTPKQKRKRESGSKQGSPKSGKRVNVQFDAESAGIEEGLSKRLKLNPSASISPDVQCADGHWEHELQELADHIASTG